MNYLLLPGSQLGRIGYLVYNASHSQVSPSAHRAIIAMFNVVLVEPQIPQNTGNIARLCAATEMQLIIAGQPGFSLSNRYLKRAGLDYWEFVRIKHEPDLDAFFSQLDMAHTYLLTTKVKRPYTHIQPQVGDNFLFGKENAGLPEWLLEAHPDSCFTIPMKNPRVRSLNLATSVGIVMYEMLSRFDFGLEGDYG